MRKKIENKMLRLGTLFCALLLIVSMAVPVMATIDDPDYSGGADWTVAFNSNNKLEPNFTTAQYQDVFSDMQPGDDAKVTLKLANVNSSTVNWYMDNDVKQSLEKNSVASGGIYTYRLSYKGPGAQEVVLFSSDLVGGDYENSSLEIGLEEINNSFMNNYDSNNRNRQNEGYFYLGQFNSGASGEITLYIKLDGETQGNDYQDTLAQLEMKFAVELESPNTTPTPVPSGNVPTPGTTTTTQIVKTGDSSHNLLFMILIAIAGVILLILAIISVKW